MLLLFQSGPVTLDELTRLLEQQGVAKFKLPEYLVLLQELPLTASGKVQKLVLRDNFVNGAYRAIQTAQNERR